MQLIIARHIGFCSGVKRALKLANDSLKNDPRPIYFLGEIIHNEKIISEAKKKGGRFITNPKEAKNGTLLIRAHGYPPFKVLPKVLVKDLTCPIVKQIQKNAQQLAKEGYKVVIIGNKDHPEVKGIMGYAGKGAIVIEDKKQAGKISFKKIGVVSQSTKDRFKVDEIIAVLKEKNKKLKRKDIICPEVINRQKELLGMLKKVDKVLVVGSASSSNTKSLADIAKKANKFLARLNSAKELKRINFKNVSAIGIVSGTSAPDELINEITACLKEKKQK